MLQRVEQCGVTLALNHIKLVGAREAEGITEQGGGVQVRYFFFFFS